MQRTSRLIVDLARPEDDPEIRRLLRDNPMDGAIRVSLEREPNAFLAAAVEGERHATVVARDPDSKRIVGMGTRAVWNAFVNGEPCRLGYLSQLRVDRSIRGRRHLLTAGYQVLRDLRRPDEAPFDLTSIIADNDAARRLLSRGVPGLPEYRELSGFVTLVVSAVPGIRPRRSRIAVEPGTPDHISHIPHIPEIAACLARNRPRFQAAPVFTAEDLRSPERSRGLAPSDFHLVIRSGRVVGCLALWDQGGFKQTVVRGYAPRLARWRPWINRLPRLPRSLGIPRLPDPGERLAHATISHVAVDDDDPDVFQALVESAHAEACRRRFAYVVIGFAAGHPWLPWLERRFRPRRYESVLYTVHWGEETAVLDGRLPHVEVALL